MANCGGRTGDTNLAVYHINPSYLLISGEPHHRPHAPDSGTCRARWMADCGWCAGDLYYSRYVQLLLYYAHVLSYLSMLDWCIFVNRPVYIGIYIKISICVCVYSLCRTGAFIINRHVHIGYIQNTATVYCTISHLLCVQLTRSGCTPNTLGGRLRATSRWYWYWSRSG